MHGHTCGHIASDSYAINSHLSPTSLTCSIDPGASTKLCTLATISAVLASPYFKSSDTSELRNSVDYTVLDIHLELYDTLRRRGSPLIKIVHTQSAQSTGNLKHRQSAVCSTSTQCEYCIDD